MENDIPTARITLTLLSGVRRRIMCPIADDTSFDALCQRVRDGFANACGAAVRNFKVEFIELDGIQCVVQSNSVLRKCLRDYISVAQSSGVEVDFHFLAEEIVEPALNVPPANEVMDQETVAPVNSRTTDMLHLDFDTVDAPVVLNERAPSDDVPQASTSQVRVYGRLLPDEAVVEPSGSSVQVNASVQNSPPSTPSRPGIIQHSPAKDKVPTAESISFKIPKEELFDDSQSEMETAPPQPPAKSAKKKIRKTEKLSERSVTVRKSPKKKPSMKAAKKAPPPTLIQDFIASRSCRPTADVAPAKEPKKRMLSHQLGFRDSPQDPSTSREASFLLVEADMQKVEKAPKKARLSVSKVKEKKTSKKIPKKHPFSRDSSPEASTSREANAVASRKKGKEKVPRKPRLAASKMKEKKAFKKKSSEGSKTPKKKTLPKESTPELPSPSPPKKHFLRSGRASEESSNVASTSADVEMPVVDEVEVVTLSESEQERGVYKLPMNYNGYKWITETFPCRTPYVPQVGDIVNYYADIHRRYCVSASVYPFMSEKVTMEAYQPFDDSFYLQLERVETLEVVDLDFEIISPVDRTRLVIVYCERKNCADPVKMNLTLYLQEIPGELPQEAEFLVLKQFVDQAEAEYARIGRDGYVGRRAKTLVYKDGQPKWFNGKVERMGDPQTESQPVTFLWDTLPGQTISTEEPVGLWDVFLYPDQGLEVENQKTVDNVVWREIGFKPEAAGWPEEGMGRFTHRLWKIASFLEGMPLLVKNLPLSLSNSRDPAAVDKWKFYQSVPYPVTLGMISERLIVRYYRKKSALEFDVKQLQTTMLFLTDDEELQLKTRIICEVLMEGTTNPSFYDTSVYQFVEEKEAGYRADQLTAFGRPRRVSFTSPQDRYHASGALFSRAPYAFMGGSSSRL